VNLFHVNIAAAHPEHPPSKTLLVIARTASEAMTLVPEGQKIASVEVYSPCKPGTARIVGWMGPPPPLPMAVKR